MLERIGRLGLLAGGLSLAACAEAPLAPTDTPPGPPITFDSAPQPLYAVPSSGVTYVADGQQHEYAFVASFDIVVRASPENHVGISVSSDSVVVQQLLSVPVDGPGGGVDRELYRFESREDGVRVEPGGEIARAFDVWYTLPSGGPEALISVTLDFVDDNDVSFSLVHQVRVEP